MLKKSVVFILIILITLSPVYSISLFPREQPIYTSNINIEKVLRTDNNLQLLISANKNIDGLIIQINNNQIITSDNKIDRYSTISILVMSKETPTVIEVNSYNDFNHRRTINKDNIIYTITNQEQPILEQPSLITTIQPEQQQEQPQQLVNEPEYISYTSISKLDDEKNLIYFTKDHISSNRITTNQQGGIEYQANYQPYGNIFTQEGNEKFKFSGKELDSTNLYYFGARYYNSNIGRFTQVDPIFKPTESPYQYANNNPIKYVDPTGKEGKLAKFYKGVTQITEEVIAHNPEAPKIPITLYILSGSKDSPYISATTDYGTAIKFRGVQGDIVEFTAADVKGHILTTKDIVARI